MKNNSKQVITRITTADTKNVYDFPATKESDYPQLWEVQIKIDVVDNRTGCSNASVGYTPSVSIYVERQTLVNAGLMPVAFGDLKPTEEQQRTVEDLMIELLEHVGVYPNGGE